MPEPLLNLLKLFLLALLYLFFLRVLRAVWAEVAAPRPAPAASAPAPARSRRDRRPVVRGRGGPPRLVVRSPAEHRGRRFELGEEITVGRAAGCQVTLDDSYVSQLHARVFTRDGSVYVEDLGSTNGTYLNRAKVTAARVMKPGDQLQIGQTILELER